MLFFDFAFFFFFFFFNDTATTEIYTLSLHDALPIYRTVAERPTRVVVTLMCCLAAGVYPSAADRWGQVALAAWAVTGVVGLVQLGVVVRRRLRGSVTSG